jgi:hypothetical protein
MRRFVIAAVLVAALGSIAGAQPIPTAPPPPVPAMPTPQPPSLPPVPPPPAVYHPDVYVPPGAQPGPAIPYFKSTGVVVGAYGLYPYDTGDWLLGGTEGLTRQSGSFTMVAPGVFPAAPSRKHQWFRR